MKFKYLFGGILGVAAVFLCLFSFSAYGLPERLLFECFPENDLSSTWEIKKFEGKADYGIVDEEGNYVFRLRSDKSSFLVYKRSEHSLAEQKKIRWSWKVTRLPQGGDVRMPGKNDQAAQLYVRFPIIENPLSNRFFGMIWNKVMQNDLNAHVIGYLWDCKAPVGFTGANESWPFVRYIVLQSGEENLNNWVVESRDLGEDYKMLFNHTPPRIIQGIAMMINSNNTKSSAESFFDNFVFETG